MASELNVFLIAKTERYARAAGFLTAEVPRGPANGAAKAPSLRRDGNHELSSDVLALELGERIDVLLERVHGLDGCG